jgi:hypothetical protein
MIILSLFLLFSPQQLSPQQVFVKHCATCHGEEARGTAKGPGLANNPRVAQQSAEQLRAYIERGNVNAGMPAFADLSAEELASLVRYLRRINVETIPGPPIAADSTRKSVWGPPQPGDWRTYNGNDSANRYSLLKQISRANVASLKLKWVFPISYFGLEVTPLAADGVIYVTGPNEVYALDGHSRHGGRPAFLRRTQWRLHCRGPTHGQNPVALPNQCPNESLAHDLRARRQAVCCRRRRSEYPPLRSVSQPLR